MKHSKFLSGLFTLIIAFTISACKDDETTPSKMEMITSKTWRITEETKNGIDSYKNQKDCEKDGFITFTKAGVVTSDEGPTKCYSGDDQTYSGTWSFQENETIIGMVFGADGDEDIESYKIEELTPTKLKLSYSYQETVNGTATTYNVVITLTGK